MNVKETLAKLTAEQRDRIMRAFDKCESELLELDGGAFIGVHLVNFDQLIIEENRGCWFVGHISRR